MVSGAAAGGAPPGPTAPAGNGAPAAPPRGAGALWKSLGEPNVVGRAVIDGKGRRGVVWLCASTAPHRRAPAQQQQQQHQQHQLQLQQPWRDDIYWLAWRDGEKKWTYECPEVDFAGAAGPGGAGASAAVGVLCVGAGTTATATTAAGGTTIVRVAKPGVPYRALAGRLEPRFEDHPFATEHLTSVLLPAQERGWQQAAGGNGNGVGGGGAAAVMLSPARAVGNIARYLSNMIPGTSGAGGNEAAAGAGGGGQETTSPELGKGMGAPLPPLALQRAAGGGGGGKGSSAGKASVKAPKAAPSPGRVTRGSPAAKLPAAAPATGKKQKPPAAAAAAAAKKKEEKNKKGTKAKPAAPAASSKKRPADGEAGLSDDEDDEEVEETADAQPPTEQISADPEATRTDTEGEDDEGDDLDDRGTEDEAVVPSPATAAAARGRQPHKRARASPASAAAARPNPKYSKAKGKGKNAKPVSFRASYPDPVTGRAYALELCRADGDRAADEYCSADFADDEAYEIERFVATRAMRQRRADGTKAKTPTRYVLVKWKGFELDVGDAAAQTRNGGWERLEALREGGAGARDAADEAWEAFDKEGGRQEAFETSAELEGGQLAEEDIAWLQAAPVAGGAGKKKGAGGGKKQGGNK